MPSAFWLGLFLGLLGTGCYVLLARFTEEDLPENYASFNTLLVLAILVNALLVRQVARRAFAASLEPWASLSLIAACLALAAAYVLRTSGRRSRARPVLRAGLAVLVLYVLAETHALARVSGGAALYAAYLLSLVSSALLLGSCLMTMILGHWYLIPYGASFKALIHGAEAFRMACVLRLLTFALAWLLAWRVLRDGTPLAIWMFHADGPLAFSLARVLWGLAAPLAISFLVVRTARMRSNQSATGLLYASLILVLLGELLAYQLMARSGFPA